MKRGRFVISFPSDWRTTHDNVHYMLTLDFKGHIQYKRGNEGPVLLFLTRHEAISEFR